MVPRRAAIKVNQSETTWEYLILCKHINATYTLTHLAEKLILLLFSFLKSFLLISTYYSKTYSSKDPKSTISQAILDLIKEKRKLRRLYNNTQNPDTKSAINMLQKEIRTKINQESTISWGKICNSIGLESDPKESWRKITNFLKPGPTLCLKC